MKPDALAREAATPGFALEPADVHAGGVARGAAAEAPGRRLPRRARARDRRRRRRSPTRSACGLLVALRRHPEFAWVREGAWLDTLTGTKAVRAALERGDSVDAILAAEAPAIARWRRERKASLLY